MLLGTITTADDLSGTTLGISTGPYGSPACVTIACSVAGTRLRVSEGEGPMETLRPGDLALTATGLGAPIHWVGRRRID
jgi:hypothetical protein